MLLLTFIDHNIATPLALDCFDLGSKTGLLNLDSAKREDFACIKWTDAARTGERDT